MTRDFAFIQTGPGTLFVGWGPFEQLPLRRLDRPSFFITDFFLSDPHPWRHPSSWEEITMEDFASRFPHHAPPPISWAPAPADQFRALFESAQGGIRRGEFSKIVPVVFETGALSNRVDPWAFFAHRLRSIPESMWIYGFSYQTHGLIGATPEILFRSDWPGYRTMAIAGTRPRDRAEELWSDAKELREHRMVVDDISRRLAPFGNVEVGPIDLLELPSIAHLATPIRFEERGNNPVSFVDMVRRLHPTAALGVWPRTEAGERWLREADRGVKRRTFGAPFGLEREDRSALALVAIRNIHWQREQIRVGSGGGVLAESRFDRELEELRQKREQVKELFGLAAASHDTASTLATTADDAS